MTDEERLRNLERLRDSLVFALGDVERAIDDIVVARKRSLDKVRGESVSLPDSFSEDKEKFLAP
tara:strand:+ start:555 stop:746 length:192 start_codon:yes stop_codon:yes gene_type:complete